MASSRAMAASRSAAMRASIAASAPRTIRPQCARTARASRLACMRDGLITAHQVHSATAVVAEHAWSREERPRADAIVTATPGLARGVLTADCAPVLFADPEARVVAAAHAGWRGAFGGVIEADPCHHGKAGCQARAGARRRGTLHRPGRLRGGPRVRAGIPEPGRAPTPASSAAKPRMRGHISIWRATPSTACGRPASATSQNLAPCTYAHADDFFSYRRSRARKEADYGRQISAIVLT